jgi:methyltransferase (TIGR00027 family)
MEQRQRSKTAEATAAVRARHLLYEEPVIFEDPFAVQLTSRAWRTICKSRILDWIICRKILGTLAPIQAQILARSRYAEEQLEKAMAIGIDQYVLLGAGLDSFALRRRDLATTLRVYELDHPASQQTKIYRLGQLRIGLPENLEFVSADFEEESVADALARSTYIRRRPAFFSWLGTVHYLTRDAVFGTLGSIASLAAPGSEIVFDYRIPKTLVDPVDLPTLLPHGASSKEKAYFSWGLTPQKHPWAIHPRSSERGILAFSRKEMSQEHTRSHPRGMVILDTTANEKEELNGYCP